MSLPVWLEVKRYGFGRTSTLGWVSHFVDGQPEPLCFSLEDERRLVKVQGETCIGTGTYELTLRAEGGMHQDYLRRFGDQRHKGMLWLRDVPEFEFVYFHVGNKERDTAGCILVGLAPIAQQTGEFQVARSVEAYLTLYDLVVPRLLEGERGMVRVTETQPWP